MSNSLVRKSLELSGYEDIRKNKKKKRHNGYKGALELIPVKHRIISPKEKTNINAVLGRLSKATVYEVKKQLESKQDSTEETVQNLLLLSSNRIDRTTVDKVLKRAGKIAPEEKKDVKEESTVFTEEDFKKFEEEYIDE